MKSINTIGGVLVKSNNKVLLCKRAPNKSLPNIWSIPCGHVEKDEHPLDGAKREFFEETGLHPNKLNFAGIINKHDNFKDDKEVLMYVFDTEFEDEILPDLSLAKDGEEHTECKYFSLNDLPLNLSDQLFKIIKKVLKN